MRYFGFLPFVSLIPRLARAAVPMYGQCGGISFTGELICASGGACVFLNEYYGECLAAPADMDGPYDGYQVYVSPRYELTVFVTAQLIADPALQAKALKVKDIPTFIWVGALNEVGSLRSVLADANDQEKADGVKHLIQIVVYDLPDRDCAAPISKGDFAIEKGGSEGYRGYIDQLVAEIKKFPDVRVVAIIELGALTSLILQPNAKCAQAKDAYQEGLAYAIQQLASAGVYMYLDVGHAGQIGWAADLQECRIPKPPAWSGYERGWVSLVEALRDPVTIGNLNYDEIHYINSLDVALRNQGLAFKFIVDQSRSGTQNIRQAWSHWCNVKGAGFCMRPTTATGLAAVDAIVWAKAGGESDGTSDASVTGFDPACAQSDSDKPAPETGKWFQSYFETLVANANPAL